jgi:uncharacterized membrane protein YfcA
MKDSFLLLICGLGLSMLAWAILHYLGDDAFSVLSAVLLISLGLDNFRLRRALARDRGAARK